MERDPIEGAERQRERLDRDDRRDEIVRAVRAACSEEGVSRLSISSITKRVGCTRSLFYHYFPDKEAAIDAVLDDSIERFVDKLVSWNEHRVRGDVEGALDQAATMMKRMVLGEDELPKAMITGSDAGIYTAFVDRVADRCARYICESTVRDFERDHEVRIDHVYDTFYVLITGLVMYIRTHPDAPEETIKDIIASTLHIEGYTEKYRDRRPAR